MYYSELYNDIDPNIYMVGWLDNVHEFNKSDDDDLLNRLFDILSEAPVINIYGKYHLCELCKGNTSNGEIQFKTLDSLGAVTYIMPSMILHYIKSHKYMPPLELVNDLLDNNGYFIEENNFIL